MAGIFFAERGRRSESIVCSFLSKRREYFPVQDSKFFFIGNSLSLDFINTLVVENQQNVDRLADFDDVADWLHQAGVISADDKADLIGKWHGTPAGVSALKEVRQFRAVLRGMMEGLAAGKQLEASAIEEINCVLRHRTGFEHLHFEEGQVKLKSCYSFDQPVHLLVPIARSTARFLSQENLSLIKKCQNPKCILLFYDSSKNQTRRWCSMKICGNRMKAAAHYKRKKQEDH